MFGAAATTPPILASSDAVASAPAAVSPLRAFHSRLQIDAHTCAENALVGVVSRPEKLARQRLFHRLVGAIIL